MLINTEKTKKQPQKAQALAAPGNSRHECEGEAENRMSKTHTLRCHPLLSPTG